ncbi:AraC family transcriptional regulator [Paenibacillus pseudetheri]|uniref:HTH-type transcriptional activator RhaR n=1 Tax=Paenibacillus pseudetheri TaxID=2897682 RepID=A0ABM9BFY1_9BACL|nr:AraC family transcriptional regulator [Paenibacillus pseudetheri]CAH1057397.1 HTH-type transcriptional activator RhaR [Paenibacillus pseudetheri]
MGVPIKSFKQTNLYIKMLLTFTATVTLLILGLSALLYHNYVRASLANESRKDTSILYQISYSMNYMDSLAQKFMSSAIVGPHVSNLLYNPNGDKMLLNNALRNLDQLVVTTDYVHSVYTISIPLDRITSTENGGYYSLKQFYDQDAVNLLRNWDTQSSTTTPIARKIPGPNSLTRVGNVYTYVLPYKTSFEKKPREAVVVNIKANVLRELIASLNIKTSVTGNDIVVIDSNGTVINHASENMFLRNIRDEEDVRTVLASEQASGSFKSNIDGQSYNITYVSSETPKWKFISRTSYKSFMSPLNAVKSSTIFTSLIVLLLGLLFSYIMSRSLYSPFRRLIENVRLKNDELERKQRDQRQSLKNTWLKELILGIKDVILKELKSQKAELGINIDLNAPLRMIVFRIDHYPLFLDRYNERERTLLKYGIANIIQAITSAKCTSDVIDMDTDKLVLLLQCSESDNEQEQGIIAMVQSIQHSVCEYLHFSLSVTISEPIESRDLLSETYSDTLTLSLYRLTAGHGSIITPAYRAGISGSPLSFPEAKARLLLDSLKLGHIEKATRYYYEIVESLKGTPYETMLSSFMHLMFMISSSFHSVADNNNPRISGVFRTFYSEIDSFEIIEEINQTFESLFAEISSTIDVMKYNKRNNITSRIKKMIEEQYQDKNLSLNIIADELQMSKVYLGRLFKEATGKSVAEYITDVRMTRVKELLNKNNLTTKEILEECGWEDLNYFYTLFKKYFGVPLSHYKISMKNDSELG